MPRPENPLDLVYNPRGRFPTDADWMAEWRHDMRTRHYFRVVGYHELKARYGLHNHSDIEDADICNRAKQIVKKEWDRFLPPTNPNQDDLDKVGKTQIQRVRLRKVVSFQSACVAVVALELALRARGIDVDIYPSDRGKPAEKENSVRICPAVFEVEGYDAEFHRSRFPSVRSSLIRSTYQTVSSGRHGESVFADLASGHLVTEPLAQNLSEFWNSDLGGVRLCRPRNGLSYRKVSKLEVTVWPL
jgi:hypothetical protein